MEIQRLNNFTGSPVVITFAERLLFLFAVLIGVSGKTKGNQNRYYSCNIVFVSIVKKLPLFVLASILAQAVACKKDNGVVLPPPKTTEEHILDMVGTYKMVGYFSIKDPRIDSSANVSEDWTVEYLGNKRILAGNSVRGKAPYTFIYHDTPALRLVFAGETSSLTVDKIYYFYNSDSITYQGWYNSSFHTQSEYLHSVK